MVMDIEIRHLRMVAAVAASGSVTRAASELHLTQSAVSHQLRDIEERLGTPLFLRVGKRMVPTAAGERVLATARRVLDEITRPKTTCGGWAGTRPACSASARSAIPAITGCRRSSTHSAGSIRGRCRRSRSSARCGRSRRCSTGGSTSPSSPRPCTTRTCACGRCSRTSMRRSSRPTIRFASRAVRRPAGLRRRAAAALFGLARRQLHDPENSRPAGVEPERVSFVMLTEAILEMVKARLGISVMQTWAVEPALRAGDVRAIPITAARHPPAVERRDAAAGGPRRRTMDAFIDLLAARAMPARKRPINPKRNG